MSKNNTGYLKNSIATQIMERDATGYRIIDSENPEIIKRALELHEINRKTIAKTKFFDEYIKNFLSTYLNREFNTRRVTIHDESVLIDMNPGQNLSISELSKIERITGYKFKRMSGGDRYIFDKGNYVIGKLHGHKAEVYKEEIRKIGEYIMKGE